MDTLAEVDFIQVDEESIYIRSKNNSEIDQLLPDTEHTYRKQSYDYSWW